MSSHDEDRLKQMLRAAVPAVDADAEPTVDLWPAVLRRLDEAPAAQVRLRWNWFDRALLAGLAIVTVAFPASIPLLVYYL